MHNYILTYRLTKSHLFQSNNHSIPFFFYSLLLLLFAPKGTQAAWDPDAGLVPSYTQHAIVTASSNIAKGNQVTDGDTDSFWQSTPPLPTSFISNPATNILHELGKTSRCKATGNVNCTPVTDTDLDSSIEIPVENEQASISFSLRETGLFKSLSIKASTPSAIKAYIYKSNGDSIQIGTFRQANNFKLLRFSAVNNNISHIKLYSNQAFTIFEMAALSTSPTEYVIIDLGKNKEVGWIEAKHWPGHDHVLSSKMFVSKDKKNWTEISNLNPNIVHKVITVVSPPVMARYIKIEHVLVEADWAKVYVWEVSAYDRHGPYGETPVAQTSTQTLRELLGVNGIWGWGHNVHSEELDPEKGAGLYNKIGSQARNYHNLSWDVKDPDDTPNYQAMTDGHGTNAKEWLNWNKEYSTWQEQGLMVEASIQFTAKKQPVSKWNDPYTAAYNYGYAFGKHFGPTNGNGYINALEVGNEPWEYPATFYLDVLNGMARGVKAADPNMLVLPCALQATNPYVEKQDKGNYLGARLSEQDADYIDALNAHCYSYFFNDQGVRIGVHPEHPQSRIKEILNIIRFQEANLPDKDIYVTEWGWDGGGIEPCTHGECVSEEAQALYAIRGGLWFNRLGIDRLHWFFYANIEGNSMLYARSGLTGSIKTDFEPKPVFVAFQSLLHHLGDVYFLDALQETEEGWVYLYGNAEGMPTHIVAWRPVPAEDKTVTEISIDVPLSMPFSIDSAWTISGKSIKGQETTKPIKQAANLNMQISSTPLVISLNTTEAIDNSIPNELLLQGENWQVITKSLEDATLISYNLPYDGYVNLNVYNMQGQLVSQSLIDENKVLEKGVHDITWKNETQGTGIYILEFQIKPKLTLTSNTAIITKTEKLALVK